MEKSDPFQLKNKLLHVEGVSLNSVAGSFNTPAYVYSATTIDEAYKSIQDAMSFTDTLIAYAVKANGNIAILKRLAALGCGADIVSAGELKRARIAGIPPEKIVFSGVGKTEDEFVAALDENIRAIHVESTAEIHALEQVAKARGQVANIALRVNPNVDAATHPYIATGLTSTKFGLTLEKARSLLPFINGSAHLSLEGVACHIGSQLETVAPLREAVEILGRFAMECIASGSPLRSIDVGGGWPMAYGFEDAAFPSATEFGDAIKGGLMAAGADKLSLITEPGRALVGAAGALLTKVIYIKEQGGKRFAIVDAAMTELIRPALYSAQHTVSPVQQSAAQLVPFDVVGPVCESGDFLARARLLPSDLKAGDLLLVKGAGAYGREMASTYNARPLAAEVLVQGSETTLIRKRAALESLWANEVY